MENKDIVDSPTEDGDFSNIVEDAERTLAVGDSIDNTVTNGVTQVTDLNLNLEDGASQTSTETVMHPRVSARELRNLQSANVPGLSENLTLNLPPRNRPNYRQMKQQYENALEIAIEHSKELPQQRETPLLPEVESTARGRSIPTEKSSS